MLAKPPGLLIIVSQHANDPCKTGIRTINVDADTITEAPQARDENSHNHGIHLATFRTPNTGHGACLVVISSPKRLFRKPHFTSELIAIIINKAYRVNLWDPLGLPGWSSPLTYSRLGRRLSNWNPVTFEFCPTKESKKRSLI